MNHTATFVYILRLIFNLLGVLLMNDNWYKRIIGARTIKTGLATFLTAFFV